MCKSKKPCLLCITRRQGRYYVTPCMRHLADAFYSRKRPKAFLWPLFILAKNHVTLYYFWGLAFCICKSACSTCSFLSFFPFLSSGCSLKRAVHKLRQHFLSGEGQKLLSKYQRSDNFRMTFGCLHLNQKGTKIFLKFCCSI